MRCLILSILVVTIAAYSMAKVDCPKSCSDVDCSLAPTPDSCKGRIEAKSALCGCCNSCVVSVGMLGDCEPDVEGVSTVKYICPPTSVCFNRKCIALP